MIVNLLLYYTLEYLITTNAKWINVAKIPSLTIISLFLPEHSDEEPDGQLGYAKNDGRLVVTLEQQRHHGGHANGHDPAEDNDDGDDLEGEERVLAYGQAGGQDAVNL